MMVAVGVSGSRVFGYSYNLNKTSPVLIREARKHGVTKMYDHADIDCIPCTMHAEVALMSRLKATPDIVVVARLRKNGSIGNSKPCNACQALLRGRGVREIVYYDYDLGWSCERL